jgi:hypothetical protein
MVGIYILFFSERWNRKPTLYIAAMVWCAEVRERSREGEKVFWP